MKRRAKPVFITFLLILLVIAAIFGFQLVEKYTPSKEQVDLQEFLGVSGDEVAVYYNEELQEAHGIYLEGQTYLPVEWVNKNINQRFYWDDNEKLLVYALPESIVYADANTRGSQGSPLLWVNENGVYLSIGLILNYADIRTAAYDTGENKRIFVNSDWGSLDQAFVSKSGNIREKGGIKSPIITRAEEGNLVTILETMETWDKVRTQDGYVGYVEHKRLAEFQSEVLESTFEKPVYTSISMDEPVCLAWHQVTSLEGNASFDSVVDNTKGLNVIAPTWFAMADNDGNFTSLADTAYVKKAHDRGLQVWALIDNFSTDVNTEILMAKTSVRQKLVNSLMEEVELYELDGLNLDFEGIKEEAGVHYVQFIRELSVACRNKGIVLSIDNYVPTASTQFYNREEQGIVADYVIVMGYDEHYAGGDAGSVSSIGYVEDGITNTLKVVPKEKLINAIPLYTRVWSENKDGEKSSTALGIAKAKEWVNDNAVELYWQEVLGQYYGELQTEEGIKKLWMEEERSIGLKMDLVKKYDLTGVACWKLGFEPTELWDEIRLDQE